MRLAFGIPGRVYAAAMCGEDLATPLVSQLRLALDAGIDYLDIGYAYDKETSDRVLGLIRDALADGYRERVSVAITISAHQVKSRDELTRNLNRQVKALGIGSADYIIIGGLNRSTWARVLEIDLPGWMQEARDGGITSKFGFTFRDNIMYLHDILCGSTLWSSCGIELSFMDGKRQPGIGGIKFIAESGLDLIVHCPTRDESLLYSPPQTASEWGAFDEKKRLEYCLRYASNIKDVKYVISDISSSENLTHAIEIAETDATKPGNLSVADELMLDRTKDSYLELRSIACTACGCCMPCPLGIDIPRVFELYHDALMYSDINCASYRYELEGHANIHCSGCSNCTKHCPKHFAVMETVRSAERLLKKAAQRS